MRKTAQQKLNDFWAESDETRAVIKAFQDASNDNYGSFSYAAGYLGEAVVNLIMQLPKAKREEARKEFADAAKKQSDAALLRTLKETV